MFSKNPQNRTLRHSLSRVSSVKRSVPDQRKVINADYISSLFMLDVIIFSRASLRLQEPEVEALQQPGWAGS